MGWCPRTEKGQRLSGILAVTGYGSIKSQMFSELDIGGSETCLRPRMKFLEKFKNLKLTV